MGSMLEQLKQAMGESNGNQPEQQGQKPGEKPGEKPGDQAGQGGPGGTTDQPNQQFSGGSDFKETRKLKKKSGLDSSKLPPEYQKIIDAYNTAKETR